MICPRCLLDNPIDTYRCNCGYFFRKPVSKPNYVESFEIASSNKRLLSHFIDSAVIYIAIMSASLLFTLLEEIIRGVGNSDITTSYMPIIAIQIFFAYYVLFEGFSGRTLGKLAAGTKVVNEDNTKSGFKQAIFRTLCRMIPLDCFSFFGNNPVGWHDSIPYTKVIDIKKPIRLEKSLNTKNLIELKEMKDRGIITEQEFEDKKKELLNRI